MALKINLTRIGRINNPKYRVVVAEAKSKRDGKFLDIVGTYDPMQNPAVVKIDNEKLDSWMKKGAKPTETVESLIRQYVPGVVVAA